MDQRLHFSDVFERIRTELARGGQVQDLSKKFATLETDGDRAQFLLQLQLQRAPLSQLPIRPEKSEDAAVKLRNQGNEAFKRGAFKTALRLYGESVLLAPANATLALSFANRSAVLFHLKHYKSCIYDIERAVRHGYPEIQQYKLYLRKTRSQLCMGDLKGARQTFISCKEAVNISNLESETRASLINEVMQEMTKLQASANQVKGNKNNETTSRPTLPNLTGEPSNVFPCASNIIRMETSPTKGRLFVAEQDIGVGTVLMVEKPFTSVALPTVWTSHCYHCFRRIPPDFIPCDSCTEVMFCNEDCLSSSSKYHQYECQELSLLKHHSLGKMALLAYRIIAVVGLKRLLELEDELKDSEDSVSFDTYHSSDYRTVYHIVGHSSKRQVSDLFRRSAIAVYLTNCFKRNDFFGTSCSHQATPNCHHCEILVARLLLRHLQNLPCNAHEVYELVDSEDDIQKSYPLELGAAAYPTFSLVNHSCDPSIVRQCCGDIGIVRAIRGIKKGEEIVDNYSYHYAVHSKPERQLNLLRQYFFSCDCEACAFDWPLYDGIQQSPTFKCSKCANTDFTMGQLWTCLHCNASFDLEKYQKVLEKSQQKYTEAINTVMDRRAGDSLPTLLSHLSLMDKLVKRPYREYNDCQEIIKLCYNMLCNYYQGEHDN